MGSRTCFDGAAMLLPRNLEFNLWLRSGKPLFATLLLADMYAISAEMIKRWRNQAEEVTPSRFLVLVLFHYCLYFSILGRNSGAI